MFALTAAGEMLSVAQPFLEQQMHPTVIIRAFRQALEDILAVTKEKIRWVWPQPPAAVVILGWPLPPCSVPVDTTSVDQLKKIVSSSIGTKFVRKW